MTTTPLNPEREAAIRARFHADFDGMAAWLVRSSPIGALLAEVDRLRAELAGRDSTPLVARWDRRVVHPEQADDPDGTLVCCMSDDGQPVALFLEDEHRESLGLALLLPDGDGEVDPAHLELARDNEQLRAELAEALVLSHADLEELHRLLTADRYRMDKGDDHPVPQPRWEINVRISQAVQHALDAAASAGSGAS